MEIRILTQNWESGFFQSWVIQIILSEILGIPVTLESGTATDISDFYDATSALGYGKSYDFEALRRGNEVKDCRIIAQENKNKNAEYQSCAHVITEVWNGHEPATEELWNDGVIDRPGLMGALGQQGLFIPRFTAERDPSLLAHLGLSGEENRRKLAETFLRPTSWQEYCSQVSPTNCTTPDDTATRPPESDKEKTRYFEQGMYHGYFRKTEQNDCDANPGNCTGAVVDYPCGWTSFLTQQLHHLNIALEGSGDEPVSNSYSYSAMTEIWNAANHTKSNVAMRWWTPEALYQTFLGTDAEFQIVNFPPPTQDCVKARVSFEDRCNSEVPALAHIGDPLGRCAEPPVSLQRLIVKSLLDSTNDPDVPEEMRSPAYEAIKNIKIDELQLGKIFDFWLKRNSDKFNFDPRDASCRWVAENFEFLQTFVPQSFPRVVVARKNEGGALLYVAMTLSLLSLANVLAATGGVLYFRNKRAVKNAQIKFLYLLLVGLFLVAVASVLMNVLMSDNSCMSINWLILQGYTFELVPLIVKVAAVAHLSAAAKNFKRIEVRQSLLFKFVFALSGIWILYLSVWTAVDPSTVNNDFEVSGETNKEGDTIIVKSYYCSSNSLAWRFVSTGWHGVLLVCATVLAFQTRNLQKEINESLALAVLVYSQAIFATLRVLLFYLQDRFYVWTLAHYESMILSVDIIAACWIYFFPKIFCAERGKPSFISSIPIIRNLSQFLPALAGEPELDDSHKLARGSGCRDLAGDAELSVRLTPSDDCPENDTADKNDNDSAGDPMKGTRASRNSLSVLTGDVSFLDGKDSTQGFHQSCSEPYLASGNTKDGSESESFIDRLCRELQAESAMSRERDESSTASPSSKRKINQSARPSLRKSLCRSLPIFVLNRELKDDDVKDEISL